MTDSVILITGAAGGLGKAFAVECAARGYNLFLTDLRCPDLEILAEGLRCTYRVTVKTHACDLTDAAGREGLLGMLHAQKLSVWGLVNVAGVDYEGPFFERSYDQIHAIIQINIVAALALTHDLIAQRDPRTPFRIINVASLAAVSPMPAKATYAASKRFLLDFSLALREEIAPLGATVTVLCPAGLPTTPECLAAIQAQGWLGHITTQNVGSVAAQTLDAALMGRAVVIPGWVNRVLRWLSGWVPPAWSAHLIGRRWQAARQKQAAPEFRQPAPPLLPADELAAST